MADLRQAARRLLDAVEDGGHKSDVMAAADALRAALAQQAEPLNLSDPAVQKRLATQWGYVPQQAEPVEPVQRKPLTEDEIWGLAANCLNSVAGQLQFARAIERAHGIKEKA